MIIIIIIFNIIITSNYFVKSDEGVCTTFGGYTMCSGREIILTKSSCTENIVISSLGARVDARQCLEGSVKVMSFTNACPADLILPSTYASDAQMKQMIEILPEECQVSFSNINNNNNKRKRKKMLRFCTK
jgi:hypothetical protein